MKSLKISILFFLVALVVAGVVMFGLHGKDRDTLYQVSVLSGLMKGDYDGKVSLREVGKHGDIGLGTYDRLDGEAIELDGVFYQVRSDGAVRRMESDVRTPFIMTTFFDADIGFPVASLPDHLSLQNFIDDRLPTKNIPYAIRIDGIFSHVKTRSVPVQSKPYPPLTEVAKTQSVFEFNDIEGTLVGFRLPGHMQGVNMPGYHIHFLSRDKTKGGHVLECAINSGEVKIDDIDNFMMVLPGSPDFYGLDLASDAGEVRTVESGK